MKNYQKLKDIIIKANNEIENREILFRYNRVEENFEEVLPEITLPDVLIALNNKRPCPFLVEQVSDSEFSNISLFSIFVNTINAKIPKNYLGEIEWSLKENLDNQTDETKEFLINILVK